MDLQRADVLVSSHMGQAVSLSSATQNKFAQLADLLEKASRLARELSHPTPELPNLERPATIPPDEAWFWADGWLTDEEVANEDLRVGRYKTFTTAKELLHDLHAWV